MLASKAHTDYLSALADTGAHIHAVPIDGNDTALTADALATAARLVGLKADAHETIEAALATIEDANAHILIAGSLYLAGAVLAKNA
jgi:dihydrofolate synthase/folylpolyglutamate synthase